MAEELGTSKNQIFRFIHLTNLIPELLGIAVTAGKAAPEAHDAVGTEAEALRRRKTKPTEENNYVNQPWWRKCRKFSVFRRSLRI